MKKIIVVGSRSYKDYNEFVYYINEYLSYNNIDINDVMFFSGACKYGADNMINKFCKEVFEDTKYKNYLIEVPVNWKKYGKAAGIIRNTELINIAFNYERYNDITLIAFWDYKSTGTKDVIDKFEEKCRNYKDINIKTIIIDVSK